MNNSAICLLCVKPNKIHVDFFNSISNYKLFMLCDDNIDNIDNTNIEFIKIDDNECFERGFKNSNFFISKNPSAWDKVFYYFSKINSHKYDYVWIDDIDIFKKIQSIKNNFNNNNTVGPRSISKNELITELNKIMSFIY